MPADHDRTHRPMSALARLVPTYRAWRQRRIARRHSFMGLSNRMLADIGVRRADVYGAMVGAMPLVRSVARLEGAHPDAAIYALPRPRAPKVAANDLSAAA